VTLLVSIFTGGLVVYVVVLLARQIDAVLWRRQLVAFQLELPRQLTHDQVSGWLSGLGALTRHIPVALEIDADEHGIRHVLAVPRFHAPVVLHQARTMLPGLRAERAEDYEFTMFTARAAGELRVSSTSHPLGQERAANMARAFLTALQPLAPDTRIRVSWLIAGTTIPHPVKLAALPPDLARFRRLKTRTPLLKVVGRIGVSGPDARICRALLYRVYSTMRVLDAPGAALTRRILPWRVVAARLRDHAIPLTIWPAILNTRELAGLLGFPLDGADISGLTTTTSRQLPPAPDIPRGKLVLGYSNYPGMEDRPLGLRQADRLRHLWLLGPTGTGKSTLIANMAVQDARAGYGLVVIDPKADLCDDILARLPEERRDDVLVLNPAATERPIGFNILASARSEQERELVVDNVVRIFADVWKSSFGPRTTDVMRNALLTLTAAKAPDGSAFTLAEVALLLEQPAFRRFVTMQPTIPQSVRSFWQAYDMMSAGERGQTIAPSLNKLRALTTRSSLRLILGQSQGFAMSDVFTRRRILLVPLNKGTVGSETAALFGSLVMASLWSAGLKRAELPPDQRRPVWVYLDEFQDVLRIASDISDALAQARALGIGFTLAHQYLAQLSPALQAAVLGTARSSVAFQLDQDDAKTLERRYAPSLTSDDLMGLRAYEVAMRLCVDGQVRAPNTGSTLPLGEPTQDAFALAQASRERFGTPRAIVEAALHDRSHVVADVGGTPIGRGRRKGAA
jgi:Type IV secretion-system coupling protein DNA-binding domain